MDKVRHTDEDGRSGLHRRSRGVGILLIAVFVAAGAARPGAVQAADTGDAAALPAAPRAFAQCAACHSTEPGVTVAGPSLAGVYGRRAGTLADFTYSSAMKQSGITWDAAALDAYLRRPQQKVPGNQMAFAGLPDAAARAAVIAYLKLLPAK